MFYNISWDQLVAENNFYRKLNSLLHLNFLYKACKPFYGKTGNPSIDPVVFFKMCLYGYLEGIVHDRELERRIKDSLEARWFIGYDLDEDIPWHSTISRTRKTLPVELYEELFKRVLGLCVSSGMVSGEMISIDSTLVKANASLDSMAYKEPVLMVEQYLSESLSKNEVEKKSNDNQKDGTPEQGDSDKGGALQAVINDQGVKTSRISNDHYESKTDPDSRLAKKPGFKTDLYYTNQLSADNKLGVITAVLGTNAQIQDSDCLLPLIEKSKKNLDPFGVKIEGVVSDSHYVSGANLKQLALSGVQAYMPIQRQGNSAGGYNQDHFTYHEENNEYRCPNNKKLKYRSITHKQNAWIYKADKKDCDACDLKAHCAPGASPRKIQRSFYTAFVDQMKAKVGTAAYNKAMRARRTVIEGTFANAKNNHGLKRVRGRGLLSAQKEFLMIAITQNLKKYVKYGFRPVESGMNQLSCSLNKLNNVFTQLIHSLFNTILLIEHQLKTA